MKSFKILTGALLITILFSNCHDEKKETELSNRILELEKELENCKNGEEKLTGIIKNSFESKDYQKVIETFKTLSSNFPGSSSLTSLRKLNDESLDQINKIKAEEENRRKAEIELKKKSLTQLKLEYDDIRGISWYKQRYYTHYSNSNKTSIYIGKEKGKLPFLRLEMSYTGSDWIFFENAYLSYEGNTLPILFDKYGEKESDNGYEGVWEWIDVRLDDSDVEWLRKFAQSKDAKMRLTGKYTKDRKLTSQERQGIIDVLNGYQYLKENP